MAAAATCAAGMRERLRRTPPRRHHRTVHLRDARDADLPGLVALQEEASVAALGHLFPQDRHPFPREAIAERWRSELADPEIAVSVATDEVGDLTGFAARRYDELLHFGTAVSTWGTGLAVALHDAVLAGFAPEVDQVWLRVLEENHRARRFWERRGWEPNGRRSHSVFAPHPVLVDYVLPRSRRPGPGAS